MNIRPLTQNDFDRVLAMMEVFYASDALLVHPSRKVLAKTLSDAIASGPYVRGFGFDLDGILAGYGMVSTSYSTEAGGLCAWIEDIYIEPEFRGRGFGTAFLEFVRAEYGPKVVRIRLEAEPENERAMAVYRKAGYETLGYTQLVLELN